VARSTPSQSMTKAIELPPSREFDCACSICAHFEFDTRCAETSPDNLQQREVAGQ